MIKRILLIALVLMSVTSVFAGEETISVTIDGNPVYFQDYRPTIIDGRTLVPIRGVFEALGFEVDWDASTRTAMLTNPDYVVSITIGNAIFTTNGINHALDVPAQVINGRTMLPIRAVLESVGCGVLWDSDSRTVAVTTSGDTEDNTPVEQDAEPNEMPMQTPSPDATPALTSITLPNRRLTDAERQEWIDDYYAHGGPTDREIEIVRLVNIERANHNLSAVEIDPALMMAARFFAQQAHDLRGLYSGSHNFGPYATNPSARHGASANVAAAFGARLRWNGGNWHSSGSSSAEGVVRGWMNSSGHRAYILSPEHRFIGAGQFPGGISYLYLSDRSSQDSDSAQSVPTPELAPTPTPSPARHNITVDVNDSAFGSAASTNTTSSAQSGFEVTLRANPRSGYEFERWEVVYGDIALADENSGVTTFTMPDNAVSVMAILRPVAPPADADIITITNHTSSVQRILTITMDSRIFTFSAPARSPGEYTELSTTYLGIFTITAEAGSTTLTVGYGGETYVVELGQTVTFNK